MVGAGLLIDFDDQKVGEARIAFLSVGVTPVRAKAAERALVGSVLDGEAIRRAQAVLEGDLDPPEEKSLTPSMRVHLARVLLGRLLQRLTAPA
jgi:aerobic carbon-monoxide dehydrogenase medium subunit